MAIVAGHGHVPAGEREPGFVMPAQREIRRRIGLYGMAILAAIIVRRARELAFVDVRMAVQTLTVFETIIRALPGREVALGAKDGSVFSLQGVPGGGVLGHPEFRGLEPLHGVTGLAGATVLARAELSVMRIRSVAIGACSVRQWGIEDLPMVTGAATHFGVLA
jgi:hypothetical protein